MKKLSLLILVTFIFSCSRFDDGENFLPSEIDSKLPVVNIVVDQDEFDNMLDYKKEEIEIKGRFNLSRDNVLVVEDEEVELELKGNYSLRFPLKTLGIKFEDSYNNRNRSLINPEVILPHHNIDKVKAIRLRNSGNDFEKTMLKDLSMTQLAINAGLDLDLTYGEPVLVYVNEEFYGLMNLRTEANAHGVSRLYGAKKDDVTLAKITTREFIKKNGDFDRIDNLLKAIEDKDIAYLKSEIDVSSFIDYMVFQSYIGNTDWPHNNARLYAINGGKFRFVLFDLDNVSRLKMHKSPLALIDDNNIWSSNILQDLFMALYEDENDDSFQVEFWNRYNEILESGNISSEKLEVIVDENISRIKLEMEYQIEKYNAPRTMLEWEIELDKMMILFREREEVVKGHVLQ